MIIGVLKTVLLAVSFAVIIVATICKGDLWP